MSDFEQEPPAFVHLVVEYDPASLDAERIDPHIAEPGADPAMVDVVRVAEAEDLGDAWLRAWRDLYRATCEVETRIAEPPGPRKLASLRPAIAGMKSALERAQQARAGESVVRWRVRTETETVETVARELYRIGLADELGWEPFTYDLRRAFEESKSQQDLRALVVGRWGESALLREVHVRYAGRGPEVVSGPTTLSTILALSTGDFGRLRSQLSVADALERFQDERHHREEGFPPGIPDWIGLQVEDASPQQRLRLVLEGAAIVRSVLAGSPAAVAGFATDDAIWCVTVTGTWVDDSEMPTRTLRVEGESGLGRALSQVDRICGLARLDVIRDGQSLQLEIPLPGLTEEEKRREREALESLNRGPVEKSDDSR